MKRRFPLVLAALIAVAPPSSALIATSTLIASAGVLVACSSGQVDEFKARLLARLKDRSAKFTNLAQQIADKVPGNAGGDILKRIIDNNDKIQAATELGPVLRVYAGAAVRAGRELLDLAEMVPGIGAQVGAVRDALGVLQHFSDRGSIDDTVPAPAK